jgi:D-alanine-D-alanine ligase
VVAEQRRMRVGVLFGGRSGEHEVSLSSAAAIVAALDPERFTPVLVGITRDGRWMLPDDPSEALRLGPDAVPGTLLAVRPGAQGGLVAADGRRRAAPSLDVVFPVLHGPNGEDGTVQGLLELCGLPYVGSGVLGSAVGMDKALMKHVFRQNGLPVVDWLMVSRHRWESEPEAVLDEAEGRCGYPCFVKPANLGSSVGISKALDRAGLRRSMDLAAGFDRRLLVERGVDAREIECSVLGNDAPVASVPGEILPSREFYDYEAKYLEGSGLLIPAPLTPEQEQRVRRLAVEAFLAVDAAGMARVDFFLDRRTGEPLVNELNTIPGFTRLSMFPKLWEASGLSFPDLVARLVELSLQRHGERQRTRTDR